MSDFEQAKIIANQWILDETHGDSELAGLIERRESLFVRADNDAGLSLHDESSDLEMRVINAQIRERKHQLGIDSTKEP